jgi:hypothetical protein
MSGEDGVAKVWCHSKVGQQHQFVGTSGHSGPSSWAEAEPENMGSALLPFSASTASCWSISFQLLELSLSPHEKAETPPLETSLARPTFYIKN